MPHRGTGLRRHHTGGAAARDKHLFPAPRKLCKVDIAAELGIDGAAHGRAEVVRVAAPVAAGAGTNVLRAAAHGFVDELVVRHVRLGHDDDVGLAVRDDLLRLRKARDVADDGDGDVQALFRLRRERDVELPPLEIGRDGEGRAVVEEDIAARDVDDVHKFLRALHELEALLELQAVGRVLLRRDAALDHHIRHRLTHGAQHLERVAHTVFKAAAVLVRAVVRGRGDELRQQVVVGAVYHDDAQSGVFAAHSAVHEAVADVVHVLAVHGLDIAERPAVERHVRGRERGYLWVVARPASGVRQLDAHLRAVLPRRAHHLLDAVDAAVARHVELAGPGARIAVDDGRVADGEIAHADVRLPRHIVEHFLRHIALRRTLEHHGRGVFQAVFQRQPAYFQRLEHMGVQRVLYHLPSSAGMISIS